MFFYVIWVNQSFNFFTHQPKRLQTDQALIFKTENGCEAFSGHKGFLADGLNSSPEYKWLRCKHTCKMCEI